MKFLLLSALILVHTAIFAQQPEPFAGNGKYGFSKGDKVIVPAIYDYVTDFRKGLALVRKKAKWGFIDQSGNEKTPFKYDKAEPFSDFYARVWVGNNIGLIDTNGLEIAVPGVNWFEVEKGGFGVRILAAENCDTLQGFASPYFPDRIPVKYKSISLVSGSYIFCKVSENNYDVYHKGKLFMTDIITDPFNEYEVFCDNCLVLQTENNFGIVDYNGTIVQPFEFGLIESVPVPEFEGANGYYYRQILLLDKAEQFYSPESGGYLRFGQPQYLLATSDGKLVSDRIFTQVTTQYNPDGTEELIGMSENTMVRITLPDKIEILEYARIDNGLDYSLAQKPSGETVIFDSKGIRLDSFEIALLPQRMRQYYTEEGEDYYISENLYEPYADVGKISGEDTLWALYSIYDKKIISEWERMLVDISSATANSIPVVLLTAQYGKAFFLPFMKKASPYEYEEINVLNYEILALRKKDEWVYEFYSLEDEGMTKIARGKKIVRSTDATTEIQHIEEGSGEYYYEPVSMYNAYFMYLIDENDKISIVRDDYSVIPLLADSLIQTNDEFPFVLEYYKDGKWGMVNIATSEVTPADQPERGSYQFINGFMYRDSDDKTSYINSKGKVFYSLAPEPFVFKKGSRSGMKVYSDFEEKEVVIIQPVFKELKTTNTPNRIIAQNNKSKWGVLDYSGDTILPFIYDEIYDTDLTIQDYNQNSFYIYKTRIAKKYGITTLNSAHTLPVVYDNIYFMDYVFTEQNGKFRVFSFDNLVLKVNGEFDAVAGISDWDNDNLYFRKNNLWFQMPLGSDGVKIYFHKRYGADLLINGVAYQKTANGYYKINSTSAEFVKDPVEDCGCDRLKLVDNGVQIIDEKGKLMYPDVITNFYCEPGISIEVTAIDKDIVYRYNLLKKKKTERAYRYYW